MSWFKDLAGKAEILLNQIDQNAAVALQKENTSEHILTEVTWDSSKVGVKQKENVSVPVDMSSSVNSLPIVRSSPNLANVTPTKVARPHSDDDLIKFLNSAGPALATKPLHLSSNKSVKADTVDSTVSSLPHFSSIQVEEVNERSHSTSSSMRGSPHEEMKETVVADQGHVGSPADNLTKENGFLKNELRSANNEMLLLLQRAKTAEREYSSVQQELTAVKCHLVFVQQELTAVECHLVLCCFIILQCPAGIDSCGVSPGLVLFQNAPVSSKCSSVQQELTAVQMREAKLLTVVKEEEQVVLRLQTELCATKEQVTSLQEIMSNLQAESRLEIARDREHHTEVIHVLKEQLSKKELQLQDLGNIHNQQVADLQQRLCNLEAEHSTQLSELQSRLSEALAAGSDTHKQCEKLRREVEEALSQLDQYRARAQRILQDKDRLIAELRGEASVVGLEGRLSPLDDITVLELEQLRQERELLREESVQVCARLQAAREELQGAESRLDAFKEQTTSSMQALQNSVQEEKRKRQAAEEDCKTQAEELRSLREELTRERATLASKAREWETELTKLRNQLSKRPSSVLGGELESRLHALTQTLVLKQTSLEQATTEKNALRLQLEKLESKHRETIAQLHLNQEGVVNVNDTDDEMLTSPAKARVPSFLVESPFDTSVTRRVKRAYSSLDAVSIRTGVFLRRYPVARTLVACYMVLLHLWVMLVLFTYTPEAHQ
uniref:Golgin-84 n=1 Tax=Timema genevievae TaxID=629358 RepID=A0A7R9JS31_TIMGE|nr:unnamed protein product [Timema genevievae]